MAPYLGLDLKLSTSKIITNFSKQSSSIQDESKKIEKIENYIKNLEEERRKIEVFKRELPLCIILLDDVICGMKDELEICRKSDEKDMVLGGEELMPIKSKLEDEGGVKFEQDYKDEKMNWMSSAQLWSDNNYTNENNSNNHFNNANNNKNGKKNIEREGESGHRLESFAGAFVPFRGLKKEASKVTEGLPDLSLVSGAVTIVPSEGPKPKGRCHVSSNGDGHVSIQSPQQQGPRKARRSWSRELHRRFVVALQQLGGAQVATPKLIRELMKVDDLTNDEVKSHLQKYRLHARRVPNSSSSTIQSIALTGGLWAAREQQYAISQHSASTSASPEGPLQLAVSSSRAFSASCYEDGKSESCSWK